MLRRPLSLGLLVALSACAPADGHGRSAPFPPLKAAAGPHRKAQRVERRVRRIEASLLGSDHARDHARQRARAARRPRAARAARAGAPLEPDNTFQPASVGGIWAPGVKLPIIAIHATLMHTGKVLIFSYPWRTGRPDPDNPGQTLNDPGYADAYVVDPVTGDARKVAPPIDPATGKPAHIFCAGSSTLPDGRVLVTGGNVGNPTDTDNRGLNTVYTFDPVTESWQTHPRMRQGRWYPTQLEMADGRTLILAGQPREGDPDWDRRVNQDVEIFSPDGTLQRLENFKTDEQPGSPPLPGQYPHAWWMPSGHALIAGPRRSDTWIFNAPTPGADNASWQDIADLPTQRQWAGGALLPSSPTTGSTRVMLFGGAERDDHYSGPPSVFPAVGSTTSYDESAPGLGWQAGPDMHVPRAFTNSVLLPDGKVALVGGGSGEDSRSQYYRWLYTEPHKRVEVFDPATNTFTFGNAQAEARTYHSAALLLPDGRVMSAGDDINGPTGPDSGVKTDTAEMWSPPYLYEPSCLPARRPVITSAPASVAYGTSFTVGTPDAVARAVLVAPGAVTHNTDMSQRVVALADPVPVEGGVNLQAPASANLAPPGYYMLFLLDARGVPSVSRFVQVGGTAPGMSPAVAAAPVPDGCPKPEPSPTPTPTPTPTSTPTVTPPPPGFRVRVSVKRTRLARLRRTGRLIVKLTLTGPGRAKLATDLQSGRKLVRLSRLARPRTVSFNAPSTRTVRVRLTQRGRRRLKGRRTARVRLTVTARPRSGTSVRVVRRLRLR